MTESRQTLDAPTHVESIPQAEHSNYPSAGWIVLAIAGGGVAGMATVAGDIVSAIILTFILLVGIRGYRLGAMKIASGVLGILAAINWAPSFAPYLGKIPQIANVAVQWNQFSEPQRKLICLIGAGVLIGLAVMLMTRALAHVLFRAKPRLKWADRWTGATLGGVEGIVLSAIFLFALTMLEPLAQRNIENSGRDESRQVSYAWNKNILALTNSVRGSSVGKVLESLEPLRTRFDEQMQNMTGVVEERNGPGDSFQSNLMRMIDQFKNDPDARSILSSKTNLDDETLRSLLDSREFNETLKDMMPNRK